MTSLEDSNSDDSPTAKLSGAMSEQRRNRIRLDISREASRLFWEQGVSATSGEQIAETVGLSVRTLWRYFRNKESCAEPVVGRGVDWFLEMLRTWPRDSSLDTHYQAALTQRAQERRSGPAAAQDIPMAQMIELGKTEPAIRSVWLMACDHIEREMAVIIAGRLGPDADEQEIRLHAAAATSAMRVINEDLAAALLAGSTDELAIAYVADRLPRAVRAATGGVIGDPVAS